MTEKCPYCDALRVDHRRTCGAKRCMFRLFLQSKENYRINRLLHASLEKQDKPAEVKP